MRMAHGLVTGLLLLAADQALLAANSLGAVWDREGALIRSNLQAGKWEESEQIASALGETLMAGRLDEASGPKAFAQVSAWRALAYEEMGQAEAAEWFWYAAFALAPDIVELDLSGYSSKWERLRALRPSLEGRTDGKLEPGLVPAIATAMKPPPLPNRGYGTGKVVVSCFVTTNGRLREPVVRDGSAKSPALRYSVLSAMNAWRFEPARLNGQVVEMPYALEMNFHRP